jgi:signal transduction protein with GAF and PtsI domain
MAGNVQTFYRALYEVSKIITSSLDPEDVLNKIAEHTAKALKAKACNIRLLDKSKKNLTPGAFYGLSKGYLRKGKVELKKSGIDAEAVKGQNVYIKNAGNDPRWQYPDAAKAEGLVSIMVLPLKHEEKNVIGVLRVYSEKEREFKEDEIEFLTILANISAIAIENARLHHALQTAFDLANAFHYQTFED